jgi:hypothetical protein
MTTSHEKPFDLSGVGQLGHPATSTAAVLTSEQRSAHERAAKLSSREDADASDQNDAHTDHAKYTRDSYQVRGDDQETFNHGEGTYVTPQQNDNVRNTKSGSPANNGQKNSGGGR